MTIQIKDGNGSTVNLQSQVVAGGEHAPSQSITPDVTVTGPAAQSALNNDLLTGNANGWLDASAYQSGSIQIIGGAGITAGQVIFEQTNDTTLAPAGVPLRAVEISSVALNPNVAAIAIAASTARLFKIVISARFIRVRISTAFTGGTVQAVAVLSQRPTSFSTINVQQAAAANLLTSASISAIAAGITAIGDVGVQYRATATGALSRSHLVAAASANPTVAKAAAGRLISYRISNTTASWRYVKLHNQATAPTAGAGVVETIGVPPNSTVAASAGDGGVGFSAGIAFTTVTGAADSDATAVAAGDLTVDLFYA
jgi:hypothetical protein